MRRGYVILVWDGWVSSANGMEPPTMLKPRLHSEGTNKYGDPINWFPFSKGDFRSDEDILIDHKLTQNEDDLFIKVIRDISFENKPVLKAVKTF